MNLLRTPESLEIANKLNDFENSFYPIEFKAKLKDYKHWIESKMFFCNTITIEDEINSVISFLLTDEESMNNILFNNYLEKDIVPYNFNGNAILYFSSFIINHNSHSFVLMRNVFREIKSLAQKYNIEIHSSFTIAVTTDGERFAERNHFVTKVKYKQKYPIYTLNEGWDKSIFRYIN